MFDIHEYYRQNSGGDSPFDLSEVEQDITRDIDNLIKNRFDSLYLKDRYKYTGGMIEVLYPRISYPGKQSVIMTPDKIRFLLSFYPNKNNFSKIEKIVIKPRYIEIRNIELSALFLKKQRTLVLYLCYPHFYSIDNPATSQYNDFVSIDMATLMDKKLMGDSVKENGTVSIHSLWYFISHISERQKGNNIEKFFIKKYSRGKSVRMILNDISYYYSKHGY